MNNLTGKCGKGFQTPAQTGAELTIPLSQANTVLTLQHIQAWNKNKLVY